MNRSDMLARLARRSEPWDMVVIGGGATGAGVALDAASRGYAVALLEQSDFGTGTSSRSTKLVHGGVRYLAQGHLALVREALRERSILRANAPHVVTDLPLIIPAYDWWERPFYGSGLALYDMLGGRSAFGRSRLLSRAATLQRLPTIRPDGLRGGVEYHDGQFDDARLLINLIQTAVAHGAVALNYMRVSGVTTNPDGRVDGVVAHDRETGREHRLGGRVVINAAGALVDGVRRMADAVASDLVAPSQGIHLVLDASFLPGGTAIMVPRVGEGRVMFAIPWQGHTLLGTTDTPVPQATLDPRPFDHEIDFLLATAGRYLRRTPARTDVLSMFAGIRPLVRAEGVRRTAALSRDYTLHIDPSGLVTPTGGKWTTYRSMAETTVDRAAAHAGLPARPCITRTLRIEGGADRARTEALAAAEARAAEPLHESLAEPAARVVWAARHEMARTVEDVLARRMRTLFLDARAARAMAPQVAAVLGQELGHDAAWQRREVEAFAALTAQYLPRAD